MATLTISNEELDHVMKIIKSYENYGFLIKGVREIMKDEEKKPKGGSAIFAWYISCQFIRTSINR